MPPDQGLFREQALVSRLARNDGRPRLAMPPGSNLTTALLVVTAMIAITFLCTNQYARKETVPGLLESGEAIKRAYPPRTGIVTQLMAKRGQAITKGQPLATFSVATPTSPQDRADTLAEFDAQLEANATLTDTLATRYRTEADSATAERERLGDIIEQVKRIRTIQHEKVLQLRDTHDAARPLFSSGQLSRIEWGRFREALLSAEQEEAQLTAQLITREEERRKLDIALVQLESDYLAERERLDQAGSRIRQSRLALSAESGFVVESPADGVIAELFVQPGQTRSPDQAIASIMPKNAPLTARLLIPSRAIGFVTNGMRVNLLYDAFPYQQFGTFEAELVHVSQHALLPAEAPMKLSLKEPFFEATASIASSSISAYGEAIPLRSGMTLQADIVLEERSLIEWLLEPLLILRGRTQ